MKWLLSGVFVLAVACFFVVQDTYTVSRIIDGDTFTVSRYGKEVAVRLIGIDAPEEGSCYAEEGRHGLEEIVGESVVLEMDDSQNAYDQYGRVLAYVYSKDVFVNKEMLRRGYAREYTYIVPYLHQESFQATEHEAQAFGRGAWNVCESWLKSQCGEGMLCSL